MNAGGMDASVRFTLSGDYTVTLSVVDAAGATESCTWVQHVKGPGVRFELCWDHTGPAPAGGDLDLHVHRPYAATNADWFSIPDDCFFGDCIVDITGMTTANWGYAGTILSNCKQSPNGMNWTTQCGNPRLDVDNVDTIAVPENTNLDDPNDGDVFRAMVHYFGQSHGPSQVPVEEHPIVNVFCGGTLRATYGQTPNTLGPCTVGSTTCFDRGTGADNGLMWRVADVAVQVAGGVTTGCTVTPLHPPGATAGYWVSDSNNGGNLHY
jgi:hypothetical protein